MDLDIEMDDAALEGGHEEALPEIPLGDDIIVRGEFPYITLARANGI